MLRAATARACSCSEALNCALGVAAAVCSVPRPRRSRLRCRAGTPAGEVVQGQSATHWPRCWPARAAPAQFCSLFPLPPVSSGAHSACLPVAPLTPRPMSRPATLLPALVPLPLCVPLGARSHLRPCARRCSPTRQRSLLAPTVRAFAPGLAWGMQQQV